MPSEDFEMWTQLSDFGNFIISVRAFYFIDSITTILVFESNSKTGGLVQTDPKEIHFKILSEYRAEDFEEATLYELFSGNYSNYQDLLKFRDLLQKIIKANYRYPVRSDKVDLF